MGSREVLRHLRRAAEESVPAARRPEPAPRRRLPGAAEEAPAVSGEQSEISPETALTTALNNAGVPETDAYHIQIETDGDNGIPIYDIEFETDYGDYDFEVDIETGSIVGADYEVDEEWLDQLGGQRGHAGSGQSRCAGKGARCRPGGHSTLGRRQRRTGPL